MVDSNKIIYDYQNLFVEILSYMNMGVSKLTLFQDVNMNIDKTGFKYFYDPSFLQEYQDLVIARVTGVSGDFYDVFDGNQSYSAQLMGKMKYNADSSLDLPAVGDFVLINSFEDTAFIHELIPRKNYFARKNSGAEFSIQLIASNLNVCLIICGLDSDYSINRVERYLTICAAAGIEAHVVFTKMDLHDSDSLNKINQEFSERNPNVKFTFISNLSNDGFSPLKQILVKGYTYCFTGSSGAGKSSLINNIIQDNVQNISHISDSTSKGRHTTTKREMIFTKDGYILIDTPGMREIGITDFSNAENIVFDEIAELASKCRFKDCTHTSEPGCAVLDAVETGEISLDRLKNYRKLSREAEHFSISVSERKRRDKNFGKMVKEVKKFKSDVTGKDY